MRTLSLWLPVLAYMGLIFALSAQPSVPGLGWLPPWLRHDWLHHGAAYGGLAVVMLRAVAGGHWRGVRLSTVVLAWLLTLAYGVTDEWHQRFVPGRSAELRDLRADGIGAALGLGSVWAWGIIRRRS